MKSIASLDPSDHQPAWMTAGEHRLVEFDLLLSGRAAVQNAVMRNGEGYMRQIRDLPLYVEPTSSPAPAAKLPDLRPMLALMILAWMVIALIVIAVVKELVID